MGGPEKQAEVKKNPKIEGKPDLDNLNPQDNTKVDRTRIQQKVLVETNRLKGDILSEKNKDPDIKNAMEKIIGGCLKGALVNKLFLNQEVFQNKKVSSYTERVGKTHPELVLFMANLGIGKFADKKYEQLSPSEKLMLLTLDDTLNGKVSKLTNSNYINSKGKIDIVKFEKAYVNNMKKIFEQLTIDFQLTQLSNFGRIKTTLKEDYKLTEIEANKFIAYLEMVKNQPSNVKEAGTGTGILIGILIGFILSMAGVYFYNKIFGPGESQSVIENEYELGTPEQIARLLNTDVPFKSTTSDQKEQWKVNPDDPTREQFLKKFGNTFQNRKITMETNGKVGIEYTLNDPNFKISHFKHDNSLRIRLTRPTYIIHDSKTKITSDNTQILQTKDFENMPIELQENIHNKVKNAVGSDNNILMQSVGHTAKNFYDIYKPVLSEAGRRIDRVDIQLVDEKGVVIMTGKYDSKVLDQKGYIEPQDKPIIINNGKKQ